MLVIPDYLIYDELKRRQEQEHDGGLQPLHLPLYEPHDEPPREEREDDESPSRGVIIIDMNSWEEVDD